MSEERVETKLTVAPELAHLLELCVYEDSREIFISGEVDEDFGCWFTMVLRRLEQQSTNDIKIWLNTPGGDMLSMLTYYDAVRSAKSKIITIGTGQICSAGVLMLVAGDYRLVSESCILMIHRGEQGISGRLEDLKAEIETTEWCEKHWAELMARHTKRDKSYWYNLGRRKGQWWALGGHQIVDETLADAVLSKEHL